VVEGYSTLFREVDEQAPGPLDVVLVPVGVGSLAAATARWAAHRRPAPAVIAVEPTAAACVTRPWPWGSRPIVPTPGTSMAGLDCATPSAAAWPTLRDGLAGAVSVSDDEARQAIRDLAARGLRIGDCGAATLAALRALVGDPECAALRTASRMGPAATVLCIGSEGHPIPRRTRRPCRRLNRGRGRGPRRRAIRRTEDLDAGAPRVYRDAKPN
jgi:diaminopropionate ammonia-lyase